MLRMLSCNARSAVSCGQSHGGRFMRNARLCPSSVNASRAHAVEWPRRRPPAWCWRAERGREAVMYRAKAFFYVAAGVLLLAFTYHLGARNASGSFIVTGSFDYD